MLDMILIGLCLLVTVMILLALFLKPRKGYRKPKNVMSEAYRRLLHEHVAFYRRLDETGRKKFEDRVQLFLNTTRITGVRTNVEDLGRVLVGASAIIPIYAFDNWEYINLREVILYPETFGENFELEGGERVVMGMVGDGPLQQVMVLSKHAMREGFLNRIDKSNVAIHEFVHLVDKTDGQVDGVPEVLMQHGYVLPWLELVHKKIGEIMKNRSDINPYGAQNQAEFLAVAAEYFFERPDLLKQKHPALYEMLEKIFLRPAD